MSNTSAGLTVTPLIYACAKRAISGSVIKTVAQHDFIGIEDLCICGLSRSKTGKSFADAAHATLRFFLSYKAQKRGGVVIAVDRFFPSSKLCHVCGQIYKELNLSEREWTCPCCQTLHDRDLNAAI